MSTLSTDIVYICAETVVGAITITGNVIVLIIICWTESLYNISNTLVGNLAVADFAVGVLSTPCAILSTMGTPNTSFGCLFLNCIILTVTNTSILMLLVIAMERFIAIKFPFLFARCATVKLGMLINLLVWAVGSLFGLLPLFGWNKIEDGSLHCSLMAIVSIEYMVYLRFFGIFLTSVVLIILINLYIFFVVRQHVTRVRKFESLFFDRHLPQQQKEHPTKDIEVAKMFTVHVLLLISFWLPINIVHSITLFCSTCHYPRRVLLTATVLSHANSGVNPVLLVTYNSRFRTKLKNMIRREADLSQEDKTDYESSRGLPWQVFEDSRHHRLIRHPVTPENISMESFSFRNISTTNDIDVGRALFKVKPGSISGSESDDETDTSESYSSDNTAASGSSSSYISSSETSSSLRLNLNETIRAESRPGPYDPHHDVSATNSSSYTSESSIF